MQWENLTASEFEDAKKLTKGVAIIPIGCLEKHGNQLPLGTDMFIANDVAIKAAEIEPSLVVPIAPYGIISEASHRCGTLSISSSLQYQVLEALCEELARNGYHKIILLNGHGGANQFLQMFAQTRLEKYHDYCIYVYNSHERSEEQMKEYLRLFGPLNGSGHADVMETSEMMYLHPETVHLNRIKVEETKETGRATPFVERHIFSGINWYADHPQHIAGDPSSASVEEGKFLNEIYVSNFAKVVKFIKEDTQSLALQEEFYALQKQPQK